MKINSNPQLMTTQGVTFYYGISPGQDMRYCEQKEQDLLEAKTRCLHIMHDHEMYFYICLINLRQLEQLGCKGFAVLWDDIEPELSEEDAKHFASFAEAHCKVKRLPPGGLLVFRLVATHIT